MYKSINQASKLKKNQMAICRCPEWCEEGYMVGVWNGSEFEYDADPNGSFGEYVIAFLPLDSDGEPCASSNES